MALCPLYLTGVSNGVYYYYCFLCPQGIPVGGQDTRPHTLGQSCSGGILDPLFKIEVKGDPPKPLWLPSRTELDLSKLLEPVYAGEKAHEDGLKEYLKFAKPISEQFSSSDFFVRAIEDPGGTVVTYKGPKDKARKARIFTIEIWSPFILFGYVPLRMQVGQEVHPDDPATGAKPKKAKHQPHANPHHYHNHIKLDESDDKRDFHILLATKDEPD